MANNRDILKAEKQTCQTLVRGLNLLEFLAGEKSTYSIRELADEIKLPRSIVHRLLATLEDAGYLRRNSPLPGYRLGMKLWWLGCAAIKDIEIKEIARPYLEDLASKTKELVNIAILDGKEVLYIDKIDCSQSVRAHIPIGGKAPVYCVATGKAILAHLNDDIVRQIAAPRRQFTRKTITGLQALLKHLEQIRRRGYSINLGEYHNETGGIASAIHDKDGSVAAAIGITVPVSRLGATEIRRFGRLANETAGQISWELGYRTVRGGKNQVGGAPKTPGALQVVRK